MKLDLKIYVIFLFASFQIFMSCNSEKKVTTNSEPMSDKQEISKLNDFFEKSFDDYLKRHPMRAAILGKHYRNNEWDNLSDSFANIELEIHKMELKELESFNQDKLDADSKISYKLFKSNLLDDISMFEWRLHNYPINQEEGMHTDAPTFLINVHKIDNKQDALDYLSRVVKINDLFKEVISGIKEREKLGIIPPKFVFNKAIGSCKNLIKGFPFEKDGKDCDILADFKSKLSKLDAVPKNEKEILVESLNQALLQSYLPAYKDLIVVLEGQSKIATTDAGCWKFPNGDKYYQAALKHTTTTDLTADSIYNLGIKEVARIQGEMHAIMKQVKFKNDNLQDFFKFITTDKQFFYPNTPEGGKAFLTKSQSYIDGVTARLDEIFITKPKAKLLVMPVEKFRESSMGGAFYEEPSPDGSRPGRYYANISDMSLMPIYQMEALAYHEAIPGHHMQIAIAQELKSIPSFRKFDGNVVYDEGWALYTEKLCKEMGFYTDPYQDFGRLSMELLRAARLVVDPGIHSKKWSREKAIKYFEENTAEPAGECIKAIERYTVWPGQATGYKIGMIKIQELRAKAQSALGDKFQLRKFHDVILTCAPVTLDVLEEIVDQWIESEKK